MSSSIPRWTDCIAFLLLFSGPPKLRIRDAEASLRAETDAMVLVRLAIWGCGLIWLFIRLYPLLIERGIIPRMRAPQVIGGVLIAVLLVGSLLAPARLLTLFSIYQLAVMLFFSWMFVRSFGPESHVRLLFWGYLALAVAILGAWIVMPELVVRRGRLRGDLIGPAGAIGALGLVLCMSNVLRLKAWLLVVATSAFALVLVASQTRTAYGAFFLFLGIGLLFRYPVPVRAWIPPVVVVVLVAGLLDSLPAAQQFVIREAQGLETMSDRIPLWEHLVGTMARESPVVGLGYYSASRVLGPQYNPALGTAHSAPIEVLVGGGFVGGALFLGLFVTLLGYAIMLSIYGRSSRLVLATIGLFVICSVISVTDTDGIHAGPVGFTFWSLTALLPAVWDKLRAERFRSATANPG